MPYKIPAIAENHVIGTVPALRGFCVYMPDDPEFIANFVGAYTFFTKWVAYERDDGKTGKKAADMMWAAYEKTMESFYDSGCGDNMAFDCEAMKECLIEVARAVSVNVTVNNSCSTSGSGTLYCVNEDGDVVINPPPVADTYDPPSWGLPPGMEEPPVIDLNDELPPTGFDTWDDFNASACDAANSIVAWALKVLYFLQEILTERVYQITAVFALVVNLYFAGWAVVLSSAMLLKIAETYARLYSWLDPFEEAVSAAIADIEANRQDYVCALYKNRANASDWENDIVARIFIASSGGMDAQTQQPLWKDLLSFLVAGYGGLNTLFGAMTYTGNRTGFLSCASCDHQPPSDPCLGSEFSPVFDMVFQKNNTACTNYNVSGVYDAETGYFEMNVEVFGLTPCSSAGGRLLAVSSLSGSKTFLVNNMKLVGAGSVQIEDALLVAGEDGRKIAWPQAWEDLACLESAGYEVILRTTNGDGQWDFEPPVSQGSWILSGYMYNGNSIP